MRYIPIIGLEIHVRLKTATKMFCRCANVDDTQPPNTAICPVCTGQPGALPVVNDEAVHLGVRTGLALGCAIPRQSHFDRKQYFYPDLPKGYQISQYDFPISQHGAVELDIPGGVAPRDHIRIGITRAHLEEDAAKNIHDGATGATLVDFNRASVPLVEIVTEPDFRTPKEARFFLQELQAILRAARVSDADMEKGYMRCDANISLLEVDDNNMPLKAGYNPKIEVKNLNSSRAVEKALEFEIARQLALYEAGEVPVGATRGWDENRGETSEQRLKETNADYRYFPEPDLLPLDLAHVAEEERARLPELPQATRDRLQAEWGFTRDDARTLVDMNLHEYAEQVLSEWTSDEHADAETHARWAKLVANWLCNKLAGLLAAKGRSLADHGITAENFAEFINLIDDARINSANAQKLLEAMVDTGADPSHIMEERNLGQIEDAGAVAEAVARIIEQNPEQVEAVRSGKIALVKWFVGGVMKATEGRANPVQAEEEVKKQLGV